MRFYHQLFGIFDYKLREWPSSIKYLEIPDSVKADVEFLQSKGIIRELLANVWTGVGKEAHASEK